MRKLTDIQRKRLVQIKERVHRNFNEVWGLLSPSHKRNDLMTHLRKAEKLIEDLLKEGEEE